MRVTCISVTGLFGVFNHEIPINNVERVTIIHGPNGFGKTVMLRMIAAVAEGTTAVFQQTPFDEFSLTFEDGSSRIIRRTVTERSDSSTTLVTLEFLIRDAGGNVVTVPSYDPPDAILSAVDKYVPSPFHLEGKRWRDRITGRQHSLSAILQRFPKAVEGVPPDQRPTFFFNLPAFQVFFVQTNRLSGESSAGEMYVEQDRPWRYSPQSIDFDESPSRAALPPRVKQYSEDVVQRIRSVLADYAKHSQESDRTFPERLVRFLREGQTALPEREILSRMANLEAKRRRLFALGLLDSESGLRDLNEDDLRRAREALTIYVSDVQGKLQVFDDIADRIGSLMDIVNDRFKYKHLRIDRRGGFRVFSDANEAPIEIEDLSSGEQHELVVLYELLFRAPRNGLILVDEPEISLHVAWQSRFLADLISILQLTDAYAVVATHSPVIIGTRNDLTVELKGPKSQREVGQDA